MPQAWFHWEKGVSNYRWLEGGESMLSQVPEIIFPSVAQQELVGGAVALVNYFSQQGLMLPADESHYLALAQQGQLAVAVDNGQVVGTAALT